MNNNDIQDLKSKVKQRFAKPSGPTMTVDLNKKEATKKGLNVAKTAALTAAGGGLGLLTATALTKKLQEKYFVLKRKENPTQEDIKKMKAIKKKIAIIKSGGVVAGAGLAAYGSTKFKADPRLVSSMYIKK
jgi:hypothetical protein